MRESDLKRKLVKGVNALPEGYAQRIEDRWSVGTLDMFIKLPGYIAMWGEAKMITGYQFGPTDRQYVTGKQLITAGVPAILIGWKGGIMYVSAWTEKADLRECYTDDGKDYVATLIGYLELQDEKSQAS